MNRESARFLVRRLEPRCQRGYHPVMPTSLAADLAANHNSAKGRLVMRLYRTGQRMPTFMRRLYQPLYYVLVDVVMGISIPLQTAIGPGFTLRHGQGVVISWRSSLGANCEVHQHVTIGELEGRAPQIGANVLIGANAVLLGGIHVGDFARIGAGAVVLDDVPARGTAVGFRARVMPKHGESQG
jgi:serine O-acetyltransferase